MKKTLFELAANGTLPCHQQMDMGTLSWLVENGVQLGLLKKQKSVVSSVSSNFFLNKKLISGLHGQRHLYRVAILSQKLNVHFGNKCRASNLYIAALLHDVRRVNDNADVGHGSRSASWFLQNVSRLEKSFNRKFGKSDISEIYYSIYFHELPYEAFSSDPNYIKNKTMVDILRAADALDRYRQPKLKWWINDSYLQLKLNKRIKQFAYNLVLLSELYYQVGFSNLESVYYSCEIINGFLYE